MQSWVVDVGIDQGLYRGNDGLATTPFLHFYLEWLEKTLGCRGHTRNEQQADSSAQGPARSYGTHAIVAFVNVCHGREDTSGDMERDFVLNHTVDGGLQGGLL